VGGGGAARSMIFGGGRLGGSGGGGGGLGVEHGLEVRIEHGVLRPSARAPIS